MEKLVVCQYLTVEAFTVYDHMGLTLGLYWTLMVTASQKSLV